MRGFARRLDRDAREIEAGGDGARFRKCCDLGEDDAVKMGEEVHCDVSESRKSCYSRFPTEQRSMGQTLSISADHHQVNI